MNELFVSPNKEFEIVLKAFPTAGYMWVITDMSPEISLIDRKVLFPRAVGGSSDIQFKFRTEKLGKYSITFVLRRLWEKEPVETKEYMVTVK
jgi:predicted secreted protein